MTLIQRSTFFVLAQCHEDMNESQKLAVEDYASGSSFATDE